MDFDKIKYMPGRYYINLEGFDVERLNSDCREMFTFSNKLIANVLNILYL